MASSAELVRALCYRSGETVSDRVSHLRAGDRERKGHEPDGQAAPRHDQTCEAWDLLSCLSGRKEASLLTVRGLMYRVTHHPSRGARASGPGCGSQERRWPERRSCRSRLEWLRCNVRTLRRLRLINADRRVCRPRRKRVEGPQDQRRRALVSHVVNLSRGLHEACARRVLDRRAARHPVVERSFSLRHGDERGAWAECASR